MIKYESHRLIVRYTNHLLLKGQLQSLNIEHANLYREF